MEIVRVRDGCQIGFWFHSCIDGWIWVGKNPDLIAQEDSEDYLEGELPQSRQRVVDDILAELGSNS